MFATLVRHETRAKPERCDMHLSTDAREGANELMEPPGSDRHRWAGPAANLGDASGQATIENDIAVFVPEEAGDCKITMTFLPSGKLKVEQQNEQCGFGHNVRADGTFRKISSQKPKFDDA
jgi:hypothetical protein